MDVRNCRRGSAGGEEGGRRFRAWPALLLSDAGGRARSLNGEADTGQKILVRAGEAIQESEPEPFFERIVVVDVKDVLAGNPGGTFDVGH
jgi:hypothetical protein